MSIRLRLTLVYSVILALVLVVFSLLLYSSQQWATLQPVDAALARHFIRSVGPQPSDASPPAPMPDQGDRFDQVFVQKRDLDGNIIESPADLEDPLPLSADTLAALRRGEVRTLVTTLDGEQFLVRSQIVTDQEGQQIILQVAISSRGRQQFLATLRNMLIIGDGLVILVAFGIGWLVAGYTLRPISRITRTAQDVGDSRDFSRRVSYDVPSDEIGQLARTFNAMLTQLEEAYTQLENALQTQRRFVADASHELRTPLTTIRGNIALLQRGDGISDEERADIVSDVIEETERMMRLVNELLVLARADATRSLKIEPVAIGPLIERLSHQVGELDPDRIIEVHVEQGLTAAANEDALKQIVLALLDNVTKHATGHRSIRVTCSRQDEHVVIRVADDGPGIAPEHLPHVFDRFYRGDAARSGPGSGLGLAIAKELAEQQNGVLSVESQLGQGTEFTLHLPVSAAASVAELV